MWLPRCVAVLALFTFVVSESADQEDASAAFMQAAKALLTDKDTMNNLQGMASAFVNSDATKQVGEMFSGGGANVDGIGQIVGRLFSENNNMDEGGLSMVGSLLGALVSGSGDNHRGKRSNNHIHPRGEIEPEEEGGFDFESVLNVGSMLLGRKGNVDVLMGLMPMILENLSGGTSENEVNPDKHDHSGHSWYMPPVLEYAHVMWDHFSNSELAQALWKNSGLNKIVEQMMDNSGNIEYEKILDSFENPSARRRWIASLTNFVAEWISHLSDPIIQQRYLTTIQFVGNSFLKSQGFPKTVMFDANRPTESLARLSDALARRHLGMKVNSSMYIKPAVAYIQELITLASEKGFFMSRLSARELSKRLNIMIDLDIIGPLLKSYRAYKWAVKTPECSSQILCTINEGAQFDDTIISKVRGALLRVASFPAAWAVSNRVGMNFWSLYGAIMEKDGCIQKYPANCTAFHEEEIRVTTESYHSEL